MTNARNSYRENDVRGANANRLVVLLHDQIIHDLVQAAYALEHNDIERRTRMLNHAILVIAHLQSPLDFTMGAKVAKDLDHFYNELRSNLMQAQFCSSRHVIRQQIRDVQELREAWIEVERAERPVVTAVTSPTNSPLNSEPVPARRNWEG